MTIQGEITIEPILSFYGETIYTVCDAIGVVFTSINEEKARAVFDRLAPDKARNLKLAEKWMESLNVCKTFGPRVDA